MDGQAVRAGGLHDTVVSAACEDFDFDGTGTPPQREAPDTPEDAAALRHRLRAQLGNRALDAAQGTADRLAATGWTAANLEAVVAARLAVSGGERAARDDVAAAVRAGTCPSWALEAARARIAIHLDDLAAARAILVRGIERTPEVSALRMLMTEVLIADGSAATARAVVSHLGQPATAPGPEAARSDPLSA
jgi:hypothetical protein